MQKSFAPRRPRRWLRLAALIAVVGALAVLGGALGHGLGAFDTGDAEARATTPTPVAVAALVPTPTPTATTPPRSPTPGRVEDFPPASSPVAAGAERRGAEGQPLATSLPAVPPSASVDARGTGGGLAGGLGSGTVPGPQSAARLPETGGDDVVLGLGALGIALYLAGVALFVVPRLVAGKQQEKE